MKFLGAVPPTHPVGRRLRLLNLARRPLSRHDIVHREALRQPGLRFVQVGANDGVIDDPLHPFIDRFDWTGVMVEPQPGVFADRLEPLYRNNDGVTVVNAAVGPETGSLPLYVLSFSDERWATGKATLDRSVLQRMIDSGMIADLARDNGVEPPADREDWIAAIDVPVITVDELLIRAGMDDYDLVHVDTEGADGMIVRQFDFSRSSCRIVQFEHAHLSDEDFRATGRHLSAAGFILHVDKMDCLATRGIRIGRTSMTKVEGGASRR